MIDHVLALILVVINVMISISFVRCFFRKSKYTLVDSLLIFALAAIECTTSIILREFATIKIILNLIAMTLVSMRVFIIPFKRSLITNLLFFGIFGSLETVVFILFQYVFTFPGYSNLTNSNGATLIEIVSCLLMMIIVAITSTITKENNISRIDVKGWIAFIMFPVITLSVLMFVVYYPARVIDNTVFYILAAFAISMLFLNIVQFFLLDNIIQRETDIREKQALIDQAEHINKMYQSLSEERERQKAKSHDYLNHLNVILALAEKDNRYEEIKYIKEQMDKEIDYIDVIDTGNIIINAVLNVKYQEAQNKKILMPLIADDLRNISINDNDLVTILSNILDNAIEAAEQCDIKKIVLKIKVQDGNLYIDSLNTYNGKPFQNTSRYTTKNDTGNHGYGIANIKHAVSKNNGTCYIDAKDGIYRISIIIPL